MIENKEVTYAFATADCPEIAIEPKVAATACSPYSFRILRLGDVIKLTGYKRASLYAKASRHSPQFDPTFPRRVSLSSTGRGAVGWIESEIFNWLQSRADARSASPATLKN